MAGNPFRRSLQPQPSNPPDPSAPAASDSGPGPVRAEDDRRASPDASTPSVVRTKKTVRIDAESPTLPHPAAAEAWDQRLDPEPSSEYPPPVPTTYPDAAGPDRSDPFNRDADIEVDSTEEGQGEDDSHTGSTNMAETTSRPHGTIRNPFQNTLATMEPQGSYHDPHTGTPSLDRNRNSAEKAGQARMRASLDVDAFKRLLLTGSPAPGPAGTTQGPAGAGNSLAIESSSSEDISQRSIFENTQGTREETPRTSYDVEEEDRTSLTDSQHKEKKKPPPPTHRHGKRVSPRAPQTVPFSDFSTFLSSTPTPPAQPSVSRPPAPVPPPRADPERRKSFRTSPQPSDRQPDEEDKHSRDSAQPRNSLDEGTTSPPSQTNRQKRTPPAPPIARRRSQIRSSTDLSRSNSVNTTLPVQLEEPTGLAIISSPPLTSDQPSTTNQKPRPPPPPARRTGTSSTTPAAPRGPSPSSSHQPTHAAHLVASPDPQSPPQPPPAATSTRLSTPPARTPSTRSTQSVRTAPATAANPSAAPPPPPPPRRGSSRSSLDLPRPHHQATDDRRTVSGEGRRRVSGSESAKRDGAADFRRTSADLQRVLEVEQQRLPDEAGARVVASPADVEEAFGSVTAATTTTTTTANPTTEGFDVLAEMQRLQQEVDELRRRLPGS